MRYDRAILCEHCGNKPAANYDREPPYGWLCEECFADGIDEMALDADWPVPAVQQAVVEGLARDVEAM